MSCQKILIITSEFPPQPGGIGNHAYNLAVWLQKSGKEIGVFCDRRSDSGIEEQAFDDKLPFTVYRQRRLKPLIRTYFSRIYQCRNLAAHHDLVLVSGRFSIWTGAFIKRYSRKPVMAVVHGTELKLGSKWQQRFIRRSLMGFDSLVAVSGYTAGLLDDMGLEARVIHNGYTPSPARTASKALEYRGELNLVTVGNMTMRKGQHNVIRALPALTEHFPNLLYHLVGLPTRLDSLIGLAEELGVRDRLVIHGVVNETEKFRLLADSDIFLMLSEPTADGDVEGFGIAILEANSVGVPAVGASGCGIEDAIDNLNSGVLVDAYNKDQVLEAVRLILDNYLKFSENAVNWSSGFTWDKQIIKYLNLMEKL